MINNTSKIERIDYISNPRGFNKKIPKPYAFQSVRNLEVLTVRGLLLFKSILY